MDLRRSDFEGLNRLAGLWKTTPGAEFEAMLMDMDLTAWQDVIQYLRSLGMRENPQIVKMNICLSNDIRITLEGAGVIQAYCRDNRLTDKPFVAMLKENIGEAEPVQLGAYSARAKLKRELPLARDDARVKEVLERWDSLGKHFRNIQRFEFVAPGGIPIRFDVSIVRENAGRPARTFQEARVTSMPPRYEAEVELTASRDTTEPDKAVAHIVRGLSWLLQGRQRSFVLVSNAGADSVRDSLASIFGMGGGAGAGSGGRNRGSNGGRNRVGPSSAFRFPGPQPATLERRHITPDPEPGVPNVRVQAGGYNVTDKADGLRCLLYVAENGRVFLVDGGGRVYATGKQTDRGLAGLVLDGEWIRRDRAGNVVSHYYAFDILAAAGGKTDVAKMPFMIAGAIAGEKATENTRQARMVAAVSVLSGASQSVRGVPAKNNLQIGVKHFRAAGPGEGIFEAAAATLENAKSAPYNTDGLIFTPNASPLPIGRGTWAEQLKWKPPHENTIDFLVLVEKERAKDGTPGAVDAIGTKFREDAGQTVRYKTLRLFVGSNRDVAFADPRRTVLDASEPMPASLDEGEWREVEFRPTDPRDPMAAICFVPLDEGVMDPAAATAAATALDTDTDLIRTTRTADVIQSDMIVEMAYHPDRAPGWRWEPIRVRHDKTERWLAQQAYTGGGKRGGTMNADWVANSIWTSIHNPVTAEAIRTGRIVQCAAPRAALAPTPGYSIRRTPARDMMKAQCLRNFHNEFVKRNMLLPRTVLAPGSSLCDLAMSYGEDIPRWIAAAPSFVFGCDVDARRLNDREEGAYRRLLDKMVALGGRDKVPPMVFAQADMARSLVNGAASVVPEDQELLRRVFGPGGQGADRFDVVSCMFAIHYMFRDENTLAGFLGNLADTVKVGGYFVGCGLDGDSVARLFAGQQTVTGRDGAADVWAMTRRYGGAIGGSVPPSAAGLGLAVDVDFIGIGETSTEYLVSWAYLQARLAEVGLELLTPEECVALGLPASSQMFGETWSLAEARGDKYAMSDAMRRLSFLNRWWVFKRRSDARPAPPLETPAPPGPLTERLTEMPSELIARGPAAAGAGAGAGAAAPVLSVIPEGTEAMTEVEKEAGAMDVIEMPEPINKQFMVDPMIKEPDARLGDALKDWPWYLSTAQLVEITDLANPAIKYPSVEAALAAAKYQRATDKPDLGAQLFRVEGAIHQEYEKQRERILAAGGSEEAYKKTMTDETGRVRLASAGPNMKKYGATWDKAAWDTVKSEVYPAYLAQRYRTDARYRSMIDAIRDLGGEILFANGRDYNELGVGVRVDGSIVGGDNKVGKWMLAGEGAV